MNVKKGFKRTALVFAIFWAIGWSYVAWQSEIKLNIAHAEIQRLNRPQVLLAGPRDDTSLLY